MTLLSLIRKRDTGNIATAIPAISATQPKWEAATVARIATVAVANPKEEKTAPPPKVGAGDTATHADKLLRYLAADAGLKLKPAGQPLAPLTDEEQAAIRAWLAMIEETCPATTAEVIGRCQRDADARGYFMERARLELPKPALFPDDRRTCRQCRNLAASGVCIIAKPGGVVSARRGYRPAPDWLHRCEGYAPGVELP